MTTQADVQRAWQSNRIPMFILGVGISGDDAAQTRTTLQGLAESTGGSYYDVANGSEMLRALLAQLSSGTYRVRQPLATGSRGQEPALEARLNQPIELSPVVLEEPYHIEFQAVSKSFQLQGGEALEVVLRSDGQDLLSKPFDQQAPRAGQLIRVGESRSLTARVHRPRVQADGVTFPISVQAPDAFYTPRPDQWWIEIQPVGESSANTSPAYVFYDTHYPPSMPVPFVSWHASHWPTGAPQADVSLWVKYTPTPAEYSLSLRELQQDTQRYGLPSELPGFPGVRVQTQILAEGGAAGRVTIQVTELHGDTSAGIGSLRVLLTSAAGRLPGRVTRRFEPSNRIAIHSFEFDPATAVELFATPQARLEFCSKAAVLAGAWHLTGDQPIRVDITPAAELLPLEAATSQR